MRHAGNNDEPVFPTTAQHFEWFNAAVRGWWRALGLTDYGLSVEHYTMESSDTFAGCHSNSQCRHATIRLNTVWPERPTRAAIESKAAHEVFHLLLAEMVALAESRDFSQEEFDREEEAVVRRLEHLVAA